MEITICIPVDAPSAIASITFALFPLLSIFTSLMDVGKLMGTTEVESFVAVANMFLGQTDSPILVSKYIRSLTDSEIFVILVSGMGSMSVCILGNPFHHKSQHTDIVQKTYQRGYKDNVALIAADREK